MEIERTVYPAYGRLIAHFREIDPKVEGNHGVWKLPDGDELVLPEWNGNEFLRSDGTRPVIRTFTPLHQEPERLDLDIVLHDETGYNL